MFLNSYNVTSRLNSQSDNSEVLHQLFELSCKTLDSICPAAAYIQRSTLCHITINFRSFLRAEACGNYDLHIYSRVVSVKLMETVFLSLTWKGCFTEVQCFPIGQCLRKCDQIFVFFKICAVLFNYQKIRSRNVNHQITIDNTKIRLIISRCLMIRKLNLSIFELLHLGYKHISYLIPFG